MWIRRPGLQPTSALYLAVACNHYDIAETLIMHGADVNNSDVNVHDTCLHTAVYRDNPEMLQLLLRNKANVNAADYNDQTALHEAATYHRPRCIQILLDHRADPTLRDVHHTTALEVACNELTRIQYLSPTIQEKSRECVRLLRVKNCMVP